VHWQVITPLRRMAVAAYRRLIARSDDTDDAVGSAWHQPGAS
jgi:hypothetical protein